MDQDVEVTEFEAPAFEPPARQYEFDEHENATFRDLAAAMRSGSMAMLVLGPIFVLFGLISLYRHDYVNAVGRGVWGAVFFMIGNWIGDASKSLGRIVATTGTDITHLMASMVDMKKIYQLQRTILLIGLPLSVLGLVVGDFVLGGKPIAPAAILAAPSAEGAKPGDTPSAPAAAAAPAAPGTAAAPAPGAPGAPAPAPGAPAAAAPKPAVEAPSPEAARAVANLTAPKKEAKPAKGSHHRSHGKHH